MKVSAGGESVRDVLLRIRAEGDPGNAQRIRTEAKRLQDAEQQLTRDRSRQKEFEEDRESRRRQNYLTKEEELSARYHLARMRREKEYATERSRLDRERERSEQQAIRARQSAERAADRELVQRGTVMAREYDRNIAARQRDQRYFRQRADYRHNIGPRLGVAGIGQDAAGVLRGLGHVGIASGLFGDSTENILDGLLAVEGTFNIARYGAPLINNLNRWDKFRRPVMGLARSAATRLGIGATGFIGTGLGTSATGVAGPAALALIGTGLAATSAYGTYRDIQKYGFMGGARPGSFTDTIANAEVGAFGGVAGFFGYDPYGDKATSDKQSRLDTTKRLRAEMEARKAYNNRVEEDLDRIAGQGRDDRLGATLFRNGNIGISQRSTLLVNRAAVRQEIGALGTSNTDLERGVQLRQMELQIIKQQQELERQIGRERLDKLRDANQVQRESLAASKAALLGNQERIGSLGVGERARLGSLVRQVQASGSTAGLAPDDIERLHGLGDKRITGIIDRERRAAGDAFATEYGLDIGQNKVAGDEARLRRSRQEIVRNSNFLGKTDRSLGEPARSDFNFTINIQSEAQFRAEMQKVFDEVSRIRNETNARAASQRAAGG